MIKNIALLLFFLTYYVPAHSFNDIEVYKSVSIVKYVEFHEKSVIVVHFSNEKKCFFSSSNKKRIELMDHASAYSLPLLATCKWSGEDLALSLAGETPPLKLVDLSIKK